jgi:membrane protease YdiL (CAAX protease family)
MIIGHGFQTDKMENNPKLKKLGFIGSFAIYIPSALLMFGLTKYLIPYLSEITGKETILFFLPLILTGLIILQSEGYSISKETWIGRLRFRKITGHDLFWCFGGLIAVGVFSVLIMKGLEMIVGQFDYSPAFMSFEPLSKGRCWLLLVWFPYWILNILGEEFLWRGVMLPRQEIAFGKHAWLIHGFGWGLFHIAFGWQLLITLIPLIFIQSYIVQKTKNSWIGVIMHGGLNGPSFIAICFGLI